MLPKVTDREIEEACRLLSAYEVATIPPEDTYRDIRSADYTAYMDELIAKCEAGVFSPPDVPMGWQYYTRKAVAAALIAALLAGIAMPERVMAGYRWLVEVVEQFFEDRKTTYRYTSNADEDAEFVPMQFGYLPEGMEETYRKERDDKTIIIYSRFLGERYEYFEVAQKMLSEKHVYGSNTEIHYTEVLDINNELIKLYERKDIIHFVWLHVDYHIYGQTDLAKSELIKILDNIEFQ